MSSHGWVLTQLQDTAEGSEHVEEHCILLELVVKRLQLSVELFVVIAHQHCWACRIGFCLEVHHLYRA